ncbi:MAG: M64 family metallopeptidase [bacterium]|nr:M64 family metallopeptidase [bacterium]
MPLLPRRPGEPRPIDKLSQETYSWWKKSFVFIKRTEIKTWQAVFVIAFIAGSASALVWSASIGLHQLSLAAGLSRYTGAIPRAVTSNNNFCNETDYENKYRGNDYYKRGTLTYQAYGYGYGYKKQGKQVKYTDLCETSARLREYNCVNNSPRSTTYKCPYGCASGACKPAPVIKCLDGDASARDFYGVRNTATLYKNNKVTQRVTDFCETGVKLKEATCAANAIKVVSYNCPNGCINGACKPASIVKCEKIYGSGEPNKNLGIVFIANNYSAAMQSKFGQDVNNLISRGLLAVEPLKSNWRKINFYKIERTGPIISQNPINLQPEDVKKIAVKCADSDVIIVLDNTSGTSYAGGYGTSPTVFMYTNLVNYKNNKTNLSYDNITIAHEFGHAFANLGDEYMNTGVLTSYFTRPNIDVAGCPKWCSGEVKQGAELDLGAKGKFDCSGAYQKFLTCLEAKNINRSNSSGIYRPEIGECWSKSASLGDGWSAGLEDCDFGVNCEKGQGCFWNARAVNAFRPTKQSVMSGPGDYLNSNSAQFNNASQKAISEELKKYIK